MKNFSKDIVSSFLEYLDANNLYGWAMSKNLPIRKFKWSKNLSIYTEEAIKMFDENSNYRAVLEVTISTSTKKKKIKYISLLQLLVTKINM